MEIYMRKFMQFGFILLLILFILQSWAFFRYQPREDSEFRTHLPGMKIYNMTGGSISEKEWVYMFRVADDASKEFKRCIGARLFLFEGELFQRPIVIVPSERIFIFGEWVDRFVDLRSMFIRKDDFTIKALRHEWTHLYLHISGERFLGDIFHRDPLFFEKCK